MRQIDRQHKARFLSTLFQNQLFNYQLLFEGHPSGGEVRTSEIEEEIDVSAAISSFCCTTAPEGELQNRGGGFCSSFNF
jgi:hypothetical protein